MAGPVGPCWWRRAAVALGALAWLAAGTAAEPAAPDLRRFLDSVQAYSADFTQTVYDARGTVVEESSGTVLMQRPGRFRWNYTDPFVRTIVADGERLWLYEADLEQVTVRRLTAGLGDTPAALLTGRDDVLARFAVTRTFRDNGLDWTVLAPREADTDFAELRLGFRAGLLAELRLADRLGQQTQIRFGAARANPPVPAGAFTFTVPPGADVIDDTEL
jgi:outer membrane lipoprotein carrier protein